MGFPLPSAASLLSVGCVVSTSSFALAEIRHLTVDNAGWELVPLAADETTSEEIQIRGYKLVKHDAVKFTYTAPGHYVIDDRSA